MRAERPGRLGVPRRVPPGPLPGPVAGRPLRRSEGRAGAASGVAARLRSTALRLGLGLLALLVVWTGGSLALEHLVYHPPRLDIGPPPSTRGWAYQDVSFRDGAGLTLRAWWIPGTGAGTVVMAHGWTSSRRATYDRSGYLHSSGYNLLLFDFRGHGRSDGDYTTLGWAEPDDVRAAIDYARSRSPGPVAVIGYSMGAVAAIQEAVSDPRVAAVVADSPFADLAGERQHMWQATTRLPFAPLGLPFQLLSRLDLGYDAAQVRPAAAAAHLRQPLLVVVGLSDPVVPPAQGYAVYRAAAGPRQLLTVPGAGHTGAYEQDRATYERTVLAFLHAHVQVAPARPAEIE